MVGIVMTVLLQIFSCVYQYKNFDKKPSFCYGEPTRPDRTTYICRPAFDFHLWQFFSMVTAVPYALYIMLQSTIGYDAVIQCMWLVAAGSNFAFITAAKPLQRERDMACYSRKVARKKSCVECS